MHDSAVATRQPRAASAVPSAAASIAIRSSSGTISGIRRAARGSGTCTASRSRSAGRPHAPAAFSPSTCRYAARAPRCHAQASSARARQRRVTPAARVRRGHHVEDRRRARPRARPARCRRAGRPRGRRRSGAAVERRARSRSRCAARCSRRRAAQLARPPRRTPGRRARSSSTSSAGSGTSGGRSSGAVCTQRLLERVVAARGERGLEVGRLRERRDPEQRRQAALA